MADARAESILAAVKALLTGLTTTGANVQRGQLYPHEPTKLPALAIFQGTDTITNEFQTGIIDWSLSILIEATVENAVDYLTLDSLVDQVLNQIRKEVHLAIMVDHTLGLAYVIDILPGDAQQPQLSGDAKQPLASQVIEYLVSYRTSRVDISED